MNSRRITRKSVERDGNRYCGPLGRRQVTFAERYRQARLYARQVRARKMMGNKYEHYQPHKKVDRKKF